MARSPQPCPNCGAPLPLGETLAGQTRRCTACGAMVDAHETVRDNSVYVPLPFPKKPRPVPGSKDATLPATDKTVCDRPARDDDTLRTDGNAPPGGSAGQSGDNAPTVDYAPRQNQADPRSASADRAATPKIRQLGRFRVVSVLGQGAFGNVYRAYDPLLDREVALKVPRFVEDDPALRERFLREAKAAARLRHPNIVAIFESGHADDSPYIASEFVDGVPLYRMLRQKPPDTRTAVDWVRQIADALDYAHHEGIIHRDIKPANIMVNGAGRPQIMDFGLAKRAADEAAHMTMEGQIIGTPAYMSPEQAKGNTAAIGPHSDQYSVGVVLYELLCGQTPFLGDAWSVMSRVGDVHENPPPPRSFNAHIPRDLEVCCLKALEKDPAARYPSLHAFADDLRRWLEGRPLVARPIGPVEKLTRWCRKNKMIATLLGVVAAMVIGAAVAGFILAIRFRELATQEKTARLATEQLLIDNYTETGLAADRKGDARAAILWFANAAARSENHPERDRLNRIRVQSWLSEIAVPVHAFQPPGGWNRALRLPASGRYLMMLTAATACEIRDLNDGSLWPLPLDDKVTVALWSDDGQWLALAAREVVAVFEFPSGRPVARWSHADPVVTLTFSVDMKRLAVGGRQT